MSFAFEIRDGETANKKSIIAVSREGNGGREEFRPKNAVIYAAPIGAFLCPEIRAFTGFGARFLQPFPKSLVTVKYHSNTEMVKKWPLIAVNGR